MTIKRPRLSNGNGCLPIAGAQNPIKRVHLVEKTTTQLQQHLQLSNDNSTRNPQSVMNLIYPPMFKLLHVLRIIT